MVLAEDYGDVQALLLHSPTHTHTVRRTTVVVVTLVAGEASLVTRWSVHNGVGGVVVEVDCRGVLGGEVEWPTLSVGSCMSTDTRSGCRAWESVYVGGCWMWGGLETKIAYGHTLAQDLERVCRSRCVVVSKDLAVVP